MDCLVTLNGTIKFQTPFRSLAVASRSGPCCDAIGADRVEEAVVEGGGPDAQQRRSQDRMDDRGTVDRCVLSHARRSGAGERRRNARSPREVLHLWFGWPHYGPPAAGRSTTAPSNCSLCEQFVFQRASGPTVDRRGRSRDIRREATAFVTGGRRAARADTPSRCQPFERKPRSHYPTSAARRARD